LKLHDKDTIFHVIPHPLPPLYGGEGMGCGIIKNEYFYPNQKRNIMSLKQFNWKTKSLYLLLLFPVMSAVLAITTHLFVFKAGVALSGILIFAGLFYARGRGYEKVWMIITAFLFSIAGDWFLSNKQEQGWMFIAGIAMFFFAHMGYLLYAMKNGTINGNFVIGLLAVYLIFFFLWLSPGIAGMGLKAATLSYLVISCFSFAAAMGSYQLSPVSKWNYVAGIFLILFSDTIIALKEFTLFQALNFLILPTYYLAQLCIIFSLMVTMTNIKSSNQL
jgi:uncharacterized membrane protein YhhN